MPETKGAYERKRKPKEKDKKVLVFDLDKTLTYDCVDPSEKEKIISLIKYANDENYPIYIVTSRTDNSLDNIDGKIINSIKSKWKEENRHHYYYDETEIKKIYLKKIVVKLLHHN